MVIPRSHKSNIRQTEFDAAAMRSAAISVDGIAEAEEVHLNAGSALLFVEPIFNGRAGRATWAELGVPAPVLDRPFRNGC